jgi:hypothetical protein
MTHFYIEQKRVGRELKSGETEGEQGREAECCSKRVTALAINLTIGQIFMAVREQIILNLIKMNIKIMSVNLIVLFFCSQGTLTFHPVVKIPTCHMDSSLLFITAIKSFKIQAPGQTYLTTDLPKRLLTCLPAYPHTWLTFTL